MPLTTSADLVAIEQMLCSPTTSSADDFVLAGQSGGISPFTLPSALRVWQAASEAMRKNNPNHKHLVANLKIFMVGQRTGKKKPTYEFLSFTSHEPLNLTHQHS